MDSFSNTESTLLALIKSSLFNIPFENIQETDWDELYQEAKAQTVTALIAGCVPEEAGPKWKIAYTANLSKNLRYLHAQSELIDIFRENNIPLVILKGASAAVYYPVPVNRAMGDIDFIVPQDLYEDACTLMVQNGYTIEKETPLNTRHKGYVKGKFSYELHHHFSYDDLDIEQHIIDGLRHVEYGRIDRIEFPMLPKLANGLVLLAHLQFHLKSGLGLRQVVDWMMYVNKELEDSFWESEFRVAASKVGMEKLAITVTRMCQLYLGLSERITWCQGADENLCLSMIEDLLSYGNFGRKHGKGIVFERTAAIIHKKGLFGYLQQAEEIKFPLYHRHKWLKPFFWIYQVFYLLSRSLKMKRGTRVLSNLKQRSKKNDLLKKLDIL